MQLSRVEFAASERFFLATGRTWAKLRPAEQRKLVEAEIEREKQRSVPFSAGDCSGN